MLKVEYLHPIQDSEADVLNCISTNPDSGSHDQLLGRNQRVTWYQGLDPALQTIRKVYTTDSPILQAFWCHFGGVGGNSGCGSVCIREQDCLGIFMESGAMYHVPFPFLVREVWPLDTGVLVERVVQEDSGYDGLPTLFSLLQPMDEFSPVSCRRPTATAPHLKVIGFFSEQGVQVMEVSSNHGNNAAPLVLCYNTSSYQHSIWALLPAQKEDIPIHCTTSSSTLTTPPKPLSTSDPSNYGREATPSGLMATPVEMILSSRKPNRIDSVQLPALSQLKQQCASGSGQSHGSGSGLQQPHASGRSPFINRLQTPASEGGKFMKKFSKSLSPPTTMARVSPFSQTINSRSWSTFFSEEMSFGTSFEPLLPQVCLHLTWSSDEESARGHHPGTSVIRTCDLMGAHYVGMVIPSLNEVHMMRCNDVTDERALTLGAAVVLPGSQAISIDTVSMVIILDTIRESVNIYSGTTKMGSLDLSVLPLPLPPHLESRVPVGIRDPIQDCFTLRLLSPQRSIRCRLPGISSHPVSDMYLSALKQLLPEDLVISLLSCYYTASTHLLPSPSPSPLTHFLQWLSRCMELEDYVISSEGSTLESDWDRVRNDCGDPSHWVPLQLFRHEVRKPKEEIVVAMKTIPLKPYRSTIGLALHLVYEELKLNTVYSASLSELAQLLVRITSSLGRKRYVDHYQRDFPHLLLLPPPPLPPPPPAEEMEEDIPPSQTLPIHPLVPPHILQWLILKLQKRQTPPFPILPSVCKRTVQIIKLYSLLTSPHEVDISSLVTLLGNACVDMTLSNGPDHSPGQVILCLLQEGVSFSDLDSFPVGVALPLLDCIRCCREAPPSSWSPDAYDLIGRADISKTLDYSVDLTAPTLEMRDDSGKDGMDLDLEVLKLRFPEDLRVNEVRRMLQSAEPVRISLVQKPEVSDHDFILEQEACLLSVCKRTMALPVGRGMFTLSTVHPLPTAPLFIPPLNLSGRAPPRNSAVGLDHVDKPADMSEWAGFHNGVAAGLCLASSSSKLDSAWIVFNHPTEQESTNVYAGFLMALGLTGHLASLQDYDLYQYLEDKHELTVVGLLLGVAASNCGKMTPSLVGLLSIYFPPLLPPGSADMEISHTIQTAALLGLGFLYLGSANRHMAQLVLKEIGRTPGPDCEFAENRESYSLAAGMALGMITLGLGGGGLPGLADLQLVDQLLHLITGGRKREATPTCRGEPNGPSHLVMESELINTHVTAPGAIIALGLMYLKTNDRMVAAILDPPQSVYELDCIRPDFLLLRAMSHSLIMWDHIQPSCEWMDKHIPQILCVSSGGGGGGGGGGKMVGDPMDTQTRIQSSSYIKAGCCFGMGLRFAGSCDHEAYKCLLQVAKDFLKAVKKEDQSIKHSLEQCLMTVVLALAMTMSGSGDLNVLRLIRELRVRVWQPEVTYGSHLAVHMALGLLFLGGGRYTLCRDDVAVASLVAALYPCFPGTSLDNRYHLQALRHLYVLAARPGILVTRDLETNESCCVDVKIESGGGKVRECVTPCFLQDWDEVEKVMLVSNRYWTVSMDLTDDQDGRMRQALSLSGTIYVQPRTVRRRKVCPKLGDIREEVAMEALGSGNMALKGLTKLLSSQSSTGSRFVADSLLECMEEEKMLAFSSLLQLEQNLLSLTSTPPPPPPHLSLSHLLWQLKIVQEYIHLYPRGTTPTKTTPLLSHRYVETLKLRVWQHLQGRTDSILSPLKSYLFPDTSGLKEVWSHSLEEVTLLMEKMVWFDVPSPYQFSLTPQSLLPDVFLQLHQLGSTASDAAVTAVQLMPTIDPIYAHHRPN